MGKKKGENGWLDAGAVCKGKMWRMLSASPSRLLCSGRTAAGKVKGWWWHGLKGFKGQ